MKLNQQQHAYLQQFLLMNDTGCDENVCETLLMLHLSFNSLWATALTL